MATPSAAEFLERVQATGLAPDRELKQLIAQVQSAGATAPDAEAVAVHLVQARRLTPFQAKQLLTGRAKSFTFGAYTILDSIGHGGMGIVFQAEHRELRRLAAIKILPSNLAENPDAVARFHRDIKPSNIMVTPEGRAK